MAFNLYVIQIYLFDYQNDNDFTTILFEYHIFFETKQRGWTTIRPTVAIPTNMTLLDAFYAVYDIIIIMVIKGVISVILFSVLQRLWMVFYVFC